MANILKPKRSNVAGATPTTSNLADGELAVNTSDRRIFMRVGAAIVEIASHVTSLAWAAITGKPETATRWPAWSEVTGKPAQFTPAPHSDHQHLANVGGYFSIHSYATDTYGTGRMESFYDANLARWNIQARDSAYALKEVTLGVYGKILVKEQEVWHNGNAPSTATRWPTWNEVSGKPSTFTPSGHGHAWSDLSGGIPDDKLPVRLKNYCATVGDWNDAIYNGWYMASGAANSPGAGWMMGRVISHNSIWSDQEVWAFTAGGNPQARWNRQKLNGNWTSWRRIDSSKNWVQSGDPGAAASEGDLWIW